MVKSLPTLFCEIWNRGRALLSWDELLIISIFEKGIRSDYGNHREVSLPWIVTKALGSILLHRLIPVLTRNIGEQQVSFRPGRGCVNQIVTLGMIPEMCYTCHRPTIMGCLGLNGALDSFDRTAPFSALYRKGIPEKFANLLRELH